MRWTRHVANEGKGKWKPEGKRALGILRGRLEGNTEIDLKEIRRSGVGWIGVVEGRD
jgi:hypothetical protein